MVKDTTNKQSILIRLSAIIILFVIIFTVITVIYAGVNNTPITSYNYNFGLQYNDSHIIEMQVKKDGQFKIMQLSDLHLFNGFAKEDIETFNLIQDMINKELPDLVVATGDVVFTNLNSIAIYRLAKIFERNNTKWMYVLGNHDGEYGLGLGRQGLIDAVKKFPMCINGEAPENVSGITNYFVNLVNGSDEAVYNLSFLDTNDNKPNEWGTDYLQQDQIDWYKYNMANINLQAGKTLNSIMFMHQPIKEYNYLLNNGNYVGQSLDKRAADPNQPYDLFGAIKQIESVKAITSSHYHLNNFEGYYDGVYLSAGRWTGHKSYYGSYHEDYERGAKIITIDTINQTFKFKELLASQLG